MAISAQQINEQITLRLTEHVTTTMEPKILELKNIILPNIESLRDRADKIEVTLNQVREQFQIEKEDIGTRLVGAEKQIAATPGAATHTI